VPYIGQAVNGPTVSPPLVPQVLVENVVCDEVYLGYRRSFYSRRLELTNMGSLTL
jgi:hypothetical protein